MPDGERWAAVDVHMGRPNPARVYNWLLGGAHNYEADRQMGERLLELQPDARHWAEANRTFQRRAVEYVLGAGVRQVIDIGAGIPAVGAAHEVAARVAPDARVVYVDADPVAVKVARDVVQDNPQVVAIQGDLRKVDDIMSHPDVVGSVDLSEPVAVLLVAVLHFVSEEDGPGEILARLRDAVAPGSFVVISHASVPAGMTAPQVRAAREYSERTAPLTLRSRRQVEELFNGWRLVEPGVCGVGFWWPERSELTDPAAIERATNIPGWVGVGVKKPMPERGEERHDDDLRRPRASTAPGAANARRTRDLVRGRAVPAVQQPRTVHR